MKKIIILLLLLISTTVISANDSIVFKVNYIYTFKNAKEHKSGTDEMVLEIGRQYTAFHSRWRVERSRIFQKYRHEPRDQQLARTADMPRSRTFYSFYTDYPEKGVTTTSYYAFNIFECEERIEPIDWKYLEGDSVILGHDCLKAEGMFRGHKWTVWFTPDVPMEYGPWKLRGLPGLILYAEHDSGFFKYEAIELGKCEGEAMFHQNDKKPIKSTAKEIQELNALKFTNFDAYCDRSGLPKPLNLETKNRPSKTPIFMEKYE